MRRLARNGAAWAADYLYAARTMLPALLRPADPEPLRRTGDAAPVLLLPGVWEDWQTLRPIAERLHAEGHPVHAVTALRRNGSTVEEGARIAADYLADHDLRDVVVVAHSKGGLIGKYLMLLLDPDGRVARMAAIATPFVGSRLAPFTVLPVLRAFAPRDPTIVRLGREAAVNARITAISPPFDPHIPDGSHLVGGRNVTVPTSGHFKVLGDARAAEVVLGVAAGRSLDGRPD